MSASVLPRRWVTLMASIGLATAVLSLASDAALAQDAGQQTYVTPSSADATGPEVDHLPISASAGARLLAAYPDALAAVDGNMLVWRDGTRMVIDDGLPPKPDEAWLARPDLKDMFRDPYPAGSESDPRAGADPGRARNTAFFRKLYGDCTHGEVVPHLVDVPWLPKHSKTVLKVTSRQKVAAQLVKVSAELDNLPAARMRYLVPPAGGYNCRPIAGTNQPSAHGYGIAVDIAIGHAHYWRWRRVASTSAAPPSWRNAIPIDIVRIFERHGFIWGGRWSHYDTMHFEYRPELLLP